MRWKLSDTFAQDYVEKLPNSCHEAWNANKMINLGVACDPIERTRNNFCFINYHYQCRSNDWSCSADEY